MPWARGRDGSRISARLRCARIQAWVPWLRITATPAAAASTTRPSVAQTPIQPPTWMNSAISTIGSNANSHNILMRIPPSRSGDNWTCPGPVPT